MAHISNDLLAEDIDAYLDQHEPALIAAEMESLAAKARDDALPREIAQQGMQNGDFQF